MKNRKLICSAVLFFLFSSGYTQKMKIYSADRNLSVRLELDQGKLYYSIFLDTVEMLEKSPLGLETRITDLSAGLTIVDQQERKIDKTYEEPKIKKRHVRYEANELSCMFEN